MRIPRLLSTFVLTVVIGGIAVGACLAALIPGLVEVATAHHYTAKTVAELNGLSQRTTVYWGDGTTPLGMPLRRRRPIRQLVAEVRYVAAQLARDS